jgi:hypothetical protein
LYLGLDCSTQGLTVTAIEVQAASRRVVLEQSLQFDRDLPQYRTHRGVLRSGDHPRVVVAPPLMWAEALDTVMQNVAAALGKDLGRIAAVSGSAQQHGSVYLNDRASTIVSSLAPTVSLVPQLAGAFSRPTAPVWIDSSTSAQCEEMTRAVGGEAAIAELTGSRAFERFTAPQIRKFYQTEPRLYADTARIHLVSSFMASLVAARDAPIDHGDGSGMSLMEAGPSSRWTPPRQASSQSFRRLRPRGPSSVRSARTGRNATDFPLRARSRGPATIRAASSAPASFTRDASPFRWARAIRCSGSWTLLESMRPGRGASLPRPPATTWG